MPSCPFDKAVSTKGTTIFFLLFLWLPINLSDQMVKFDLEKKKKISIEAKFLLKILVQAFFVKFYIHHIACEKSHRILAPSHGELLSRLTKLQSKTTKLRFTEQV